MMFWLGVIGAYLTLIGVGLLFGHWLADRGGRGGGQGDVGVVPPAPVGPSHGAEWQPLGSEFDRAFLPAAFAGDVVVTAEAA
ncbi:MAG TPA: hypothetical protein VFJ17_13065 [Mycobacteriales bacterium]|jgi:hypothetical protein|nr:hypothetical protein [Mycobacteriales bacterium]